MSGYPEELMLREEGRVIIGMVNRELETVTYRVEVTVDGIKSGEMETVALDHDGEWEKIVSFTPDGVGNSQKVEFLLYKQGWDEVYQRLHLWVGV